jgi:pimeloyl-ACP methyl ester carboxylesterase
MFFFQLPWVPETAMRWAGTDRAVAGLRQSGLDAATAERYVARMQQRGAMTGPINWYRALALGPRSPLPPVSVPTLYLYAEKDRFLTRYAAERTGRYVTGPYRFEVMEGMSHWLPTGAADRVSELVLEHLAAHPS